jgi:ssDNA-binding Zn-finger/Zn-ribbon topoisomerase 1
MSRPQQISPLQVIYGTFPNAVRMIDGHITRVATVVSSRGDRDDALSDEVRHSLARRILVELRRQHGHDVVRAERRMARLAAAGQPQASAAAVDDLLLPGGFADDADAFADLAGGGETDVNGVFMPAEPGLPAERDISLIEVDQDASVRTRVFPRTAHCGACNHYLVLDPAHVPATMSCPCCAHGDLRIEAIVFMCGRCGDVRELVPPQARVNGLRRSGDAEAIKGAPITCPDCGRGHVHLEKHRGNYIARWEWVCSARCGFREVPQERCLHCVVPGAGTQAASAIFMQAMPASASNALQPLVHQEMFVGGHVVTPDAIEAVAEADAGRWGDAFMLTVAAPDAWVQPEDEETFRVASLQRAYLVREVHAVTAVYGYKPGGSASHPQSPVDPEDRLATLFSDPEGLTRFQAFCHTTKGAALAIQLDPVVVLERLDALVPGYVDGRSLDEIIEAEGSDIALTPARELLARGGTERLVYRALHAVEHALLNAAMRQLGADTLGSRLFPRTATVVLFERSQVGRGGVIQLVNRGEGLVRLIQGARDLTLSCAQGCDDGCPTCTYALRDQYCTHPLEDLGASWIPANALLSRRGAAAILGNVVGD